jgi:hypothetical protein
VINVIVDAFSLIGSLVVDNMILRQVLHRDGFLRLELWASNKEILIKLKKL